MSARNWTDSQKTAMNLTGRDLLVSAGAGSGKSSVMSERIVRRICDDRDPIRLDEMLIVTFTVAAASEMREKITNGLREKAFDIHTSPAIIRQLDNIGSANISTINSFCLDIVRRHFAQLGLPASMRIVDDAENQLILKEVMDETLEVFFSRSEELGISDFESFCENFINERDEALSIAFITIYNKLLSLPEGIEVLKNKADILNDLLPENFLESQWGKVIDNKIFSIFEHYINVFESALEYFSGDEVLEFNYGTAFAADLSLIRNIVDMRGKAGYDEIRKALLSHEFIALGRKRLSADAKTEELEYFKEVRKDFKADIIDIRTKTLLAMPGNMIPFLKDLTSKAIQDLYIFLSVYEERLNRRKISMSVLTFSDCERYAIKLLSTPEGDPTPTAIEYRERFREIYIDEYQDTNELQDRIFSLISRPGGRFMVGDIKQSIYGFRSAEPTLFASYRDMWEPYSVGDDNLHSSIYLSSNFRSSPKIINTVNSVFSPLFNLVGNIGYREEDELVCGSTDKNDCDKVKIAIVSDKQLDDVSQETTVDKYAPKRDAEYLALEILQLLEKGEPLSGIAVLVRARSSMKAVEEALRKYSIPFESSSNTAFFTKPEIELVLSLLHVIDNPTRELYLAAVLSSPLYGLTHNELAALRIENDREKSFYDIVSESDDPKLVRLRNDLSLMREKARRMPTDKLIRWLYNNYGIINAACSKRPQTSAVLVKANCERLYDLARSYESSSYKGLYSFLEYTANLSASDKAVTAASSLNDDCVKIMTVHNSKGLEFDNCFIYAASSSLKRKGQREDIVFSKSLGFGMYVREKDSPYRYDTPFRTAVICDNDNKELEEDLRVLYVALTRAKKRLWIIGNAKDPDGTIDQMRIAARYLSANLLYSESSYMSWVLLSLLNRGEGGDWSIESITGELKYVCDSRKLELSPEIGNIDYYSELRERFEYEYPGKALSKIPAKLSVSRLYPGILDEFDSSTELQKPASFVLKRPRFDGGVEDNRATSVGTATHLFMQFCDFSNIRDHGVKYELSRLKADNFLTDEIVSLVSLNAINAFIESSLFNEIINSPLVWRERRFNVFLNANEFTEDPSEKDLLSGNKLLVQGVIDCVYSNANGDLVLVDYKTDSVYGMSRDEAENMLRERHSLQLGYYKKALEKLTGRSVSKTLVYSFGLGDCVDIN